MSVFLPCAAYAMPMSKHQGLKHEHDLGNGQLTAEEKRELNGW